MTDQLHPSQRPAEPEHPMMLDGEVIDGDTNLMFRCMVEDYLMAGQSPRQLLDMCADENYWRRELLPDASLPLSERLRSGRPETLR